MTSREAVLAVLSATCGGTACLAPPPLLATRTEVVAAQDSSPVLGDRVSFRFLGEDVSIHWDDSFREYIQEAPASRDGTMELRVARLNGDVYLLQAAASADEYLLIPARILTTGEVTPLGYEPSENLAARYGVTILFARSHQAPRGFPGGDG